MPDWVKKNIDRVRRLNPDYMIMIHNENTLLDCLEAQFEKTYTMDKYIHCTQSDLIRLSALKIHGGWYFDTDFVHLRPISNIKEDVGIIDRFMLIKTRPDYCANGVLASNSDDEFLDMIITDIVYRQIDIPGWGEFGTHAIGRVEKKHPTKCLPLGSDMFLPDETHESDRENSVKVYNDIVNNNYSDDVIKKHFKGRVPYMFHIHAQGETELGNIK
jgi:hypothetical protein